MYLSKVFLALAATATLGVCTPAPVEARETKFTYDRDHFYVDGEEFIMFGGQIDPQRIPREYWGQRLQMAKAMGLNTIFSYIYWNDLEPTEGEWDWEGVNDIAGWYEAIQDAGLYAVLRPGSYICGERDWGGLPWWLSQVQNMTVRDNNPQFLDYSGKYLAQLGDKLESSLAKNGGPILMVQVENEYGSFGNNHDYTNALADIFRENFDAVLYTNDGGTQKMLEGGHIPGILAVIDGDAYTGFPARDEFITDETCLGPQLNGEWYVKWFDSWSTGVPHNTYDGDEQGIATIVKDMNWMVSNGHSFSIYVYHGGTNFGFSNGAINVTNFMAFGTSYDYGAPLDESGRPSEIYHHLRTALSNYSSSIPEVPETPPIMSVDDFKLTPVSGLLDNLPEPKTADSPLTMEALGHRYGFTLYEHEATADYSGPVVTGDGPRDRVIVYVNGVREGVIDRIHAVPATFDITLKKGDKLGLLVENLGRVDYGADMVEQEKGIVGDVQVGGKTLTGWNMYSLPLDSPPDQNSEGSYSEESYSVKSNDGQPVFYRGSFKTDLEGMAADTFLEIPDGIKGMVWVNGWNLGRYWTIGPQQQLYLPGSYLKKGEDNDVVVLELEPQTGDRVARGLSDRTWANNDDPDCGNCVPYVVE